MQDLLKGRKGLVMGVANDHSIAWGIARALAGAGAELAFTYQGEEHVKRVTPLASSVGSSFLQPCDVEDEASVKALFARIAKEWGTLDFVIHAVAFSDRNELKGRYADTTRANFAKTMLISCYSFTEISRQAAKLMPNGGSLITLTYAGATRVVPNYNVMGVAKAALESSVRYLAVDLGPQNIRVNAISAGPVRTLAGSVVSDSRSMFNFHRKNAALGRNVTLDEIGGTALYLTSDLSGGVTGEVHFVDCGFNITSMPKISELQAEEAKGKG
jgi:enoyl-[acyl-carrier protein] reductase I